MLLLVSNLLYFVYKIYLEESVQEVDTLNLRIQDIEVELSQEKEESKRSVPIHIQARANAHSCILVGVYQSH